MDQRRHWIFASMMLAALAASGCGEHAAFGGGGANPAVLPPEKTEDRGIDATGTDQPADLASPEHAAMAAQGMRRIVDNTALVSRELAHALGDLFPSKNNPCPDGGDASSDLSGSFNHPRVRMDFFQCVRGSTTLDGTATVRCEDFNGSDCSQGDVTIGDGDTVLYFRSDTPAHPRLVLMRGSASASIGDSSHLHVVADLQAELRSLPDEAVRYSFATHALTVDVQDSGDGSSQVTMDGVAGFGGDTQGAHCITGSLDTETPADPLVLQDDVIQSGRLRFSSPPPRPGTQQGEVTYSAGGLTAQGADGTQASYPAAALEQFCTLEPDK